MSKTWKDCTCEKKLKMLHVKMAHMTLLHYLKKNIKETFNIPQKGSRTSSKSSQHNGDRFYIMSVFNSICISVSM